MAYLQPSWQDVMGKISRIEANETYRQKCSSRCPDTVHFECDGCGTQFDKYQGHWQMDCKHHYCCECLEKLFCLAMRDRDFYPPSCCQTAIDLSGARRVLSLELMMRFSIFNAAAKDRDPTYCHACTKYIMRFRYSTEKATCGSCAAATCRFCKRAFHDGECVVDAEAEAAEKAAVALASREGWQSCPNCKETVELNIGCFHMT